MTHDVAARLMGLALSPGSAPAEAAAWVEGLVGEGEGGGVPLIHDERLLALVDDWLTGVSGEAFQGVLPLLRRTFAQYEPGVRRTLGELVRRGPRDSTARGSGAHGAEADAPAGAAADAGTPGFGPGLDRDRAAAVLPTVRLLLGEGVEEQRGAAGTRRGAGAEGSRGAGGARE